MALNVLAWVTLITLSVVGGLIIGWFVPFPWGLLLAIGWGYVCGRIAREIANGR